MNQISFKDVSFSYVRDDGGEVFVNPVLTHASFDIEKGEFVALVGNNGSGKSTIALLSDGFLKPEYGSVEVFGIDISHFDDEHLFDIRKKIGFVMQNPDDQFVATIVQDEVAFGPCNLGLSREEIIIRVESALDLVGMLDYKHRSVCELSGGEKQRVAIAGALAMDPEILILDEPTSMLDLQGRSEVLAAIEAVASLGTTVLLVTHELAEAALAERVLKLENGQCSHVESASGLNAAARKELVELLDNIESEAKESASLKKSNSNSDSDDCFNLASNEPIVRFADVGFAFNSSISDMHAKLFSSRTVDNSDKKNIFELLFKKKINTKSFIDAVEKAKTHRTIPRLIFKSFDMEVYPGDTVAIMGSNGCGKSTLLQLSNGLLKPLSGHVYVDGISTNTRDGRNNARTSVGLCFQFPERSIFCESVYAEIAYGAECSGVDLMAVDERVRTAMRQVSLDFDAFATRNPVDLSGGEKRRVAIASVLALRPKVLALDEPCSGLDTPSRLLLIKTLLGLKAEGQTIILSTHSRTDATILADRIVELEA